jgi:hypothetical protein
VPVQIRIRRDAVRRFERELLKSLEHEILGSGIKKYQRSTGITTILNKRFVTSKAKGSRVKSHHLFDSQRDKFLAFKQRKKVDL